MLDVRWEQRASQFEKAFTLLEMALAIQNPSIVERAGLIQFFEMAFELAWKLLKDYQESEGFDVNTPRAAIKMAFQSGLVDDGHGWIDALEDRNLTTHTYNEQTALIVEKAIRERYAPLLRSLHASFLKKRLDV